MASIDGFLLCLSLALEMPSPPGPDEGASLEVTSGHTAVTLGLDSEVPPQPQASFPPSHGTERQWATPGFCGIRILGKLTEPL